jgi:GNAT superfamily N-acetyltransferase
MSPLQKLYSNSDCRESAVLADGSIATLRLVRPTDHDFWVYGLSRLSNKSRYLCFGGAKNRLSEKDIRYFTDVDQETHFAICAVKEDSDGNEIGIGVGRFIRSADDPTHAEPAMVVTDDAQGLGLGYLLCLRLIAAARERGVERFDANILASNSIVLRMMKELGSDTELRR